MKKIVLFLVLSMTPLTSWGELPPQFVKAIKQTESGNRHGYIVGDSGKAIGELQIHRSAWKDAVKFDKSIGGSYTNCFDYKYSVKILNAYALKYERKAVINNDFDVIAHLWNQGPNWRKNPKASHGYVLKVRSYLPKQIIDNLSCHDTR